MENGGHERKLADKLSGLSFNNNNDSSQNDNNNNNSLFQVMKAVEAAEATIRQQAEENTLLRSELQSKNQQLEKYKIDEPLTEKSHSVDQWNEQAHQSASSAVVGDPTSVLVPNNGDPTTQSTLWKQDFALKVRENEEEIMQLRKHLADYSVKEAQIRNEKYVLEKRIAYMRLAFDQQQQDLVDAASKALSYRQDIIEENIRLTYELQAAQQERSAFVSSLLPLLVEYSLQPPVLDAQSIVSNVKVLFRHLQEKLIRTESKLKESQYQLAPWRSDVNHSNFAPQSPSHAALSKSGLELVPQPSYSHGKIPMSSSDTQTAADWDSVSHHQSGLAGGAAKNLDLDDAGRYSPLASRNSAAHDTPTHFTVSRGDAQAIHYGEETTNKQVMFRDPVSNSEMDDPEAEGQLNEREPPANWGSGNPLYSNTLDDPGSSYSPYLPPVLEEPSSSFSEAADDDPLPAIEGLQISGEALPGRELQACGYSINGTTSCNFEWVRHLEDGSVNYIEGAKQPNYLVTADDVETYLAIEVQPLDDRKRKGELVKVFANEHKKIRYGGIKIGRSKLTTPLWILEAYTKGHNPEMHEHIQKTVYSGHVSYKVGLTTGFTDIWEPATLAIKREGYSIKSESTGGVVVTEKFSPTISVTIPYGHALEFILTDSTGHQYLLQADDRSTDIVYARDTIVLTLRLFIKQFGERRKGKKRGIFFGK